MPLIRNAVSSIEYPDSDGKPMGESDLHIEWTIYLREVLKRRYRGQRVYVGSNLLIYYDPGNPKKFVVPDGFVVFDCESKKRRVFKTWEEGKGPDVVFEITSKRTRANDQTRKPRIYHRIGVQEIFLFDPTNDYLIPPLQGLQRTEDGFAPIEPDAKGVIQSQLLSLRLQLATDRLALSDFVSGERLLSEAERAEAAEQEVARLREQLRKQKRGD